MERSLYALLADGMPPVALHNALAALSESSEELPPAVSTSRTWTEADHRRLLLVTAEDRLAAAWRLMVLQRLTPAEVLALEWSHVQLAGGRLMFRNASASVPEHLGYAEVIDLDRGTVASLHRLRRWRASARSSAGGQWTPGNRVFTHPDGSPLTLSDLEDCLWIAAGAHGLPQTDFSGFLGYPQSA